MKEHEQYFLRRVDEEGLSTNDVRHGALVLNIAQDDGGNVVSCLDVPVFENGGVAFKTVHTLDMTNVNQQIGDFCKSIDHDGGVFSANSREAFVALLGSILDKD